MVASLGHQTKSHSASQGFPEHLCPSSRVANIIEPVNQEFKIPIKQMRTPPETVCIYSPLFYPLQDEVELETRTAHKKLLAGSGRSRTKELVLQFYN